MTPGFVPIVNTTAFDCTGHPAMSVPLFWNGEGLPIGGQLIAPHFEEAPLLVAEGSLWRLGTHQGCYGSEYTDTYQH